MVPVLTSKARRRGTRLEEVRAARRTNTPDWLPIAQAAVDRYPDDADFLTELAAALADVDRLDDACDVALNAGMQVRASEVMKLRAANMLISHRRYHDASDVVDGIIPERLPPIGRAYFDHITGVLAAESGNDEEALRLLKAAVAADPTEAFFAARLTEFFVSRGDLDSARAMLPRLETVSDPDVLQSYFVQLGLVASTT